MGAKERLLAIKLFEQVRKRPEFAKEIGLNVQNLIKEGGETYE
mgnify:CR=1 FL=1